MTHRLQTVGAIAAVLIFAAPAAGQVSSLYTAAQADAGAALYARQCSACHGAQLDGGAGPALTGADFHQMAATQHLTAERLLDVMSRSMPMTAPGKLKPEEYAAITAFILQRSGYPGGTQALSADNAALAGLDLGLDASGKASAPAASAAAMRPASEGVYTQAQAAHGKALYSDNCLTCHGGELDGVEDAPPLAGQLFLGRWGGKPVGAVHAFIDKNMPPGNGGMLGAVSEADVVAYILSKNGFPAGAKTLPADPAGLGAIILK